MKKLLLSAFLFSVLIPVDAQNNVALLLSQRLGSAPFTLGSPVSAGNYEYKINRLEYYISEIKITHDGGQVTPVADMHLLVRPAADSLYDLGVFPGITTVEGIAFSIGVDEPSNHADPASFPANNPLSPQNPSMHWGWAAGYRFVAMEGVAGNNFANIFEIHALGDVNYKTVALSTLAENAPGGKVIHLTADYTQVLNSINVAGGLIVHGESGKAVTLMNNMKNLVFSAATSATIAPDFKGSFVLSPNPSASGTTVATMALPAGFEYRVTVTDLTGRVLFNKTTDAANTLFAFDHVLNSGVYFLHLWQNERPVAVEKLMVTAP